MQGAAGPELPLEALTPDLMRTIRRHSLSGCPTRPQRPSATPSPTQAARRRHGQAAGSVVESVRDVHRTFSEAEQGGRPRLGQSPSTACSPLGDRSGRPEVGPLGRERQSSTTPCSVRCASTPATSASGPTRRVSPNGESGLTGQDGLARGKGGRARTATGSPAHGPPGDCADAPSSTPRHARIGPSQPGPRIASDVPTTVLREGPHPDVSADPPSKAALHLQRAPHRRYRRSGRPE